MNKSEIQARMRLGGDVVSARKAAQMMGFSRARTPEKWGIHFELAIGNNGENLYFFRRTDVEKFIVETLGNTPKHKPDNPANGE